MVKLRLARIGSKKNPIYRIVVSDDSAPRNGRAIENIGRYNPQLEPSLIEINEERAKYWLSNGAQPSQPVKRLLQKQGIV
ncbi:MAG: 30S ribosomal protein S16 [Gaiellales bacterium]